MFGLSTLTIRRMVGAVLLVAILTGCMPNAVNNLSMFLEPRFGAAESYFRYEDAVEAGVGLDRIIFEWRNFQPESAVDWDTSSVPDQWLLDAQRGHRKIVGLIKNAPNWATGNRLLGAPALNLDLPITDPYNRWAAFVTKLVAYYSTRYGIHDWIIYNEPDIRPQNTELFEFAGSVLDYYKTLRVAYLAAHAADPQVKIHLAGFTYWEDVAHDRFFYLERLLRVIASDPAASANGFYFDVLSIHIYAGTDWVWYIPRLYRNVLIKYSVGEKPIWITEMNVPLTNDAGYPIGREGTPISLDQQAAFIVQGMALAIAAGVDRVEIYKLNDNTPPTTPGYAPWGLIRFDGTRRPAYFAFKTGTTYFNHTLWAARTTNESVQMVTLTQPGRTVYIFWNRTDQPVHAYIQAVGGKAGAVQVSTDGATQVLDASTVKAGSYDFLLQPCIAPCNVQGEPIILIQPGMPQPAWTIRDNMTKPLKP